jgi:hypothetical protein
VCVCGFVREGEAGEGEAGTWRMGEVPTVDNTTAAVNGRQQGDDKECKRFANPPPQ